MRYLFYRAAVQNDSNIIAKLRMTRGVVCDRYIYSSIACHQAIDRTIALKPLLDNLVLPDWCFVLTARQPVRRARLATRHFQTALELNEDVQAEADRIFQSFSANVIDTSDTTVEEVGDLIAAKVLAGVSHAA